MKRDTNRHMRLLAALETVDFPKRSLKTTWYKAVISVDHDYHQKRQNTVSEQLIENNDPRFVKKLYMCVGKPIGAIDWLTQITTSRKEAERLQQEGWAVSEYTRLGFLKPLEAQSA